MRELKGYARAAVGTFAAIAIGTPLVVMFMMPIVFPMVIVAVLALAWRYRKRSSGALLERSAPGPQAHPILRLYGNAVRVSSAPALAATGPRIVRRLDA